jgi:predicted MFS family arabinose efflux permease
VFALPKAPAPAQPAVRPRFVDSIKTGARFVLKHDLLRGIGLCAIFWNFAFFSLLAIWAPLALTVLKLDPATLGLAQSALGAGQITGALIAPYTSRAFAPLVTLIFGPAISVVGVALFLVAPQFDRFAGPAVGFFLIGFGPMLWLICQTTVRQLVTPAHLMGRVNATLQTAMYGMRPLGALAGGLVASFAGLEAALILVSISFALSALSILLSPLARLRAFPTALAA